MSERVIIYTDRESFERYEGWLLAVMRYVDRDIPEEHILMPHPGGRELWPVLVVKEEPR